MPTLSVNVEQHNGKEFVDFKCRFGQLENNTLAVYNVSWFNGSAMHLKTDVIAARTPKVSHATLKDLHSSGFKLGDSVSTKSCIQEHTLGGAQHIRILEC